MDASLVDGIVIVLLGWIIKQMSSITKEIGKKPDRGEVKVLVRDSIARHEEVCSLRRASLSGSIGVSPTPRKNAVIRQPDGGEVV